MNNNGSVIAAGTTEKVVRVWDPRSCEKIIKLKGHSDNIRCLAINSDGTQILSGSSDGTIRLWSLAQRQCIQTYYVHSQGVWTLKTDKNFSTMFSSGRDQCVWASDLYNPKKRVLICEESHPVLKIELLQEGNKTALWTATTNSTVHKWVC